MSNLPITALTIEQAIKRDFSNSQISLKIDGSLAEIKESFCERRRK